MGRIGRDVQQRGARAIDIEDGRSINHGLRVRSVKRVAVETLVPRRRNASLIRIEMQEVHEDDTWHTSENPRLSSPRTPAHEKARRLHL